MKRLIAGLAALAALAAVPAAARRLIRAARSPWWSLAAGGPTDIIARIMADHMSRTLGQTIVVENLGGRRRHHGLDPRVARATPDGYTIMMGNLGTHSASVGLYPNLAYDPRTDFEPVINAAGTPMLISAHKDFPANTLQEMIALIRANPSRFNYGHGGVGSTSHLTCVFFHHLVGAPVQHVPFRGSGPAMAALLGKQLDYVCDQTVGIVPQLANLKTFVVATPARLPTAPDVPTSAEGGLPAFQAVGWNAIFAPKGTPRDIVDRLNAAGQGCARRGRAQAAARARLRDCRCCGTDAGSTACPCARRGRQVDAGDQGCPRHGGN